MTDPANWADEEWRHDALNADPYDFNDFNDYTTPTRAEAEQDAADAADWDES